MSLNPPHATARRAWLRESIGRIEADFQRSSDTHLIPVPLPGFSVEHYVVRFPA